MKGQLVPASDPIRSIFAPKKKNFMLKVIDTVNIQMETTTTTSGETNNVQKQKQINNQSSRVR